MCRDVNESTVCSPFLYHRAFFTDREIVSNVAHLRYSASWRAVHDDTTRDWLASEASGARLDPTRHTTKQESISIEEPL
jgi:hypothetical protein